MRILQGRILSVFRIKKEDKNLARTIKHILGIKPFNVKLYRLATLHSSVAKENIGGIKESNERLEYLGDAILSLIVADYLFKKGGSPSAGFGGFGLLRSRI